MSAPLDVLAVVRALITDAAITRMHDDDAIAKYVEAELALAAIANLISVALEANDLCRSAHAVAERVAIQYATVYAGTNFGSLHDCLNKALQKHHPILRPYREEQARDLMANFTGGSA